MHQATPEDQRKPPESRRSTDYGNQEMPIFKANPVSEVTVLLSLLHDDVKTVKVGITALDTRLSNHMKDETLELAEAIASIMNKSFPEGDPLGHRKHHELSIKAAEDKAAFWKRMRDEVTRWGLLGVLGWLSFVAWTAFIKGPRS